MKSYLDLVTLSEKARKRQNRMTKLCIAISVFLVTAIFSMADMMFRMETDLLLQKHGAEEVRSFFERPSVQTTLPILIVLFLLILLAGVFMIAGSMNSDVSRRTRYYGMLRCIGMSKRQMIRLVRLEALSWCKTAVPAGLILGIVSAWGLCAVLRYVVRGEFSMIRVFGFSGVSIVLGILIGLITVLIAGEAPARKAANVSPVSALRNDEECDAKRRFRTDSRLRIESVLGIGHALYPRKNLILVSGSFGLSIVLFLSFTVIITLINYLMPQFSGEAHLDIRSSVKGNAIDNGLIETIGAVHGVERVYGRQSMPGIAAVCAAIPELSTADLISYSDFELENLAKDHLLRKDSSVSEMIEGNGYALLISEHDLPAGTLVSSGGKKLRIAGQLKYDIFSGDGLPHGITTLIVSAEDFAEITGIRDYQLLLVRLSAEASDEDVRTISRLLDDELLLTDRRGDDQHSIYLAFLSCVYAFLAVIALVAVLNVINCISMSLSAKVKQFGMMRSVGMGEDQLARMVRAESITFAIGGCLAGLVLGLPLNRWMYGLLIRDHFAYAPAWSLPVGKLLAVLIFIAASAYLGAAIPLRRLRGLPIIEMNNEE